MKTLLLFSLIWLSNTAMAQSIVAHDQLLLQGRDQEALEMAQQLLQNDSTRAYANFSFGHYYVQHERCDKAVPFLQKSILQDANQTWISGWAHTWLGKCYLTSGAKDLALKELDTAIRVGKTRKSVTYANQLYDELLRDSSVAVKMPDWIVIEGKYITFKFQDTSSGRGGVQRYMAAHDNAYAQIDSVFHARLPQKMVFFVWRDRELAKRLLGKPLGFTNPSTCVSHVYLGQTKGHEVTHTLSFWSWGTRPKSRSRFIEEGTAVAFDLNVEDKVEIARKEMAGKQYHSILDVWQQAETLDEADLYSVAGAFVTYCHQHSTEEQFKALIKNQSLEAARKSYGKNAFDQLVKDFNELMGLH